jgi:hypothetical protein
MRTVAVALTPGGHRGAVTSTSSTTVAAARAVAPATPTKRRPCALPGGGFRVRVSRAAADVLGERASAGARR